MWLINRITASEKIAATIASRLVPWLSPIPTAFMVYRAAINHLLWPAWVALIAAIIVESVGIAATFITLDMRRYNDRRGQADQAAPTKAGYILIAGYTLAAAILTVLLDIAPALSSGAGLIFVGLSLAGVVVIGLNHDHDRRLEAQAERIAGEVAAAEKEAAERKDSAAKLEADKQAERERRRLEKLEKTGNGQGLVMTGHDQTDNGHDRTETGQKPAMSKYDRHAELINLAMAGQTVDNGFIVARYGVKERTARRDILALNGKLNGGNQ